MTFNQRTMFSKARLNYSNHHPVVKVAELG
jgi:hypothetical protein